MVPSSPWKRSPIMAQALHKSLDPPRFALRRDEAAASVAMSPTSFDKLVVAGKMPRGHRVGSMVLWDVDQVRRAWQAIVEADGDLDDGPNPFDGVVA